jgi:hypothetical protein
MAKKASYSFRSSVTGKYVKESYAKKHLNTTEKEKQK